MTRFVIEADVIVPHLELQRRQYSVSAEEMEKLLADVGDRGIEPRITPDELSDLLKRRGQISDVIELQGKNDQIKALLETLAKVIYYYKIPWNVEQYEAFGIGDPKFHEYIRAYTVESD